MGFLNSLFSRPSSKDCSDLVHALLNHAEALGLGPVDVENAREMLRYDESVLCFDIIANQFHSYDLEITPAFYDLLAHTGRCLKVAPESYSFNQELIRSDTHIPKPVREGLASIIGTLLRPSFTSRPLR
ncbi:hypothetical protein I2I05_21400 [Hymenobacter sp. BT683]|uniref:Uncharacterized protein n=1 Tax=Hymenobacter jeongseonensis TaxID=2791027 RepID=A0ABS0INP2_9BACT|nr:hypothetical protein [Hymenobacter jeongseonensis]MBF9239962.1 hypothetical protein [Hymenobacter jeongseonensis]